MPNIRSVTEEELTAQRAVMARLAERNAALPEAPLAWVDTWTVDWGDPEQRIQAVKPTWNSDSGQLCRITRIAA